MDYDMLLKRRVDEIIDEWQFLTQARDYEGVTTVATKDIKTILKFWDYFKSYKEGRG